jgi:hypothetical protein
MISADVCAFAIAFAPLERFKSQVAHDTPVELIDPYGLSALSLCGLWMMEGYFKLWGVR